MAASDPRIVAMAEQAVQVAEFVNQYWFRAALVICGVLLIIWPARRFWLIRHRLLYLWRAALSDEVWISEQAACALVANSDWGLIREPRQSIADMISFTISGGPSPGEMKRRKFERYCEMVLDRFAETNPQYVRQGGDGSEFLEDKLDRFLQQALDRELVSF